MVLKAAKNAIIIFLLLGIVCGVGYPALVTVIAQKAEVLLGAPERDPGRRE